MTTHKIRQKDVTPFARLSSDALNVNSPGIRRGCFVNLIPNISICFSYLLKLFKKMEHPKDPNENQLNIELTEEVAEGIYSNLAIITHSHSEFVVDFIKMMPGVPKAKVKSRIVLTPEHAKRLFFALRDNIAKFEQLHGPIKNIDTPPIPMNFGGTMGQA